MARKSNTVKKLERTRTYKAAYLSTATKAVETIARHVDRHGDELTADDFLAVWSTIIDPLPAIVAKIGPETAKRATTLAGRRDALWAVQLSWLGFPADYLTDHALPSNVARWYDLPADEWKADLAEWFIAVRRWATTPGTEGPPAIRQRPAVAPPAIYVGEVGSETFGPVEAEQTYRRYFAQTVAAFVPYCVRGDFREWLNLPAEVSIGERREAKEKALWLDRSHFGKYRIDQLAPLASKRGREQAIEILGYHLPDCGPTADLLPALRKWREAVRQWAEEPIDQTAPTHGNYPPMPELDMAEEGKVR